MRTIFIIQGIAWLPLSWEDAYIMFKNGHELYTIYGEFGKHVEKVTTTSDLDKAAAISSFIVMKVKDYRGEIIYTSDSGLEYTMISIEQIAINKFKEERWKGNHTTLMELLIDRADGQHLETLIDEWEREGEFDKYPDAFGIKYKLS